MRLAEFEETRSRCVAEVGVRWKNIFSAAGDSPNPPLRNRARSESDSLPSAARALSNDGPSNAQVGGQVT